MTGGNHVPEGWSSFVLDEVANVLDHLREPVNAKDRAGREGPYPYFGATGQVGWIDGFKFDGEFVLLGEDGAPFLEAAKPKAYIAKGQFWVNNHAHVLKGKMGVCDDRFLMHALNHIDYHPFVKGTTRLKLNQASMRRMPIAVPSLAKQQSIASTLDELFSDLDAGVAALERAEANLTRYRAAVLKAAVEGKLTEPWRQVHPGVEAGSALLSRVLDARRESQRPGGKHRPAVAPDPPRDWKLPIGWTWATVDQVSLDVTYGSSAKASKDPHGIPILRMGNIVDGHLNLVSLKYLPANHKESPDLLLRDGDLLFNRTNSAELVGKAAVYRGRPQPCSFASYLIRVRLLSGIIPQYLCHSLNSNFGRRWIRDVVSQQVGQANVNGTKLKSFTFPLPPYVEQEVIVEQTESLLATAVSATAACELALARSAVLRNGVLVKAFHGELL